MPKTSDNTDQLALETVWSMYRACSNIKYLAVVYDGTPKSTAYAYTYEFINMVFIYIPFYNLDDRLKVTTIIHELTHMTGQTLDLYYTKEDFKKLAVSNGSAARMNILL